MEGGDWHVAIDDYYNSRAERHEMLRDVANAMLDMAGGFIESAEEAEPTGRGKLVTYSAVYMDGSIDFHSMPMDTDAKKEWMLLTLELIRERIEDGGT
jgi:hypothetical protein